MDKKGKNNFLLLDKIHRAVKQQMLDVSCHDDISSGAKGLLTAKMSLYRVDQEVETKGKCFLWWGQIHQNKSNTKRTQNNANNKC